MVNEAEEDHTIIDWFDDMMDEFHAWLWDIKDRREKNIEQFEQEDAQELKQEIDQISEQDPHSLSIQKSSFWSFWLIWWISALIGYFFFQSLDLFYLVITWIILSMASEKFIRFFQAWMPRWLSIALTYILLLLFLFGGVIIVIPFLIQQTAELSVLLIDRALWIQTLIQEQWLDSIIQGSILPDSLKQNLLNYLAGSNLQQSLQSTLIENISEIVTLGSSYIKNAGDFAVTLLTNTFSALFQIAIALTVAVFGSIEKEWVSKFIASLSSTPHHMEKTVKGLYDRLWNRLVGQLLLCLSVALLVWIWLFVLSLFWLALPSGFTLALIAWLTEFIPYLGPILWAIPGVFVATLAYGFKGFAAAWVMYMVIQRTENNILVPLIMSQTLWVSPLLIFVTMLIFGSLLGLLGVIIAVPIAVILNITYKQIITKRSLLKK